MSASQQHRPGRPGSAVEDHHHSSSLLRFVEEDTGSRPPQSTSLALGLLEAPPSAGTSATSTNTTTGGGGGSGVSRTNSSEMVGAAMNPSDLEQPPNCSSQQQLGTNSLNSSNNNCGVGISGPVRGSAGRGRSNSSMSMESAIIDVISPSTGILQPPTSSGLRSPDSSELRSGSGSVNLELSGTLRPSSIARTGHGPATRQLSTGGDGDGQRKSSSGELATGGGIHEQNVTPQHRRTSSSSNNSTIRGGLVESNSSPSAPLVMAPLTALSPPRLGVEALPIGGLVIGGDTSPSPTASRGSGTSSVGRSPSNGEGGGSSRRGFVDNLRVLSQSFGSGSGVGLPVFSSTGSGPQGTDPMANTVPSRHNPTSSSKRSSSSMSSVYEVPEAGEDVSPRGSLLRKDSQKTSSSLGNSSREGLSLSSHHQEGSCGNNPLGSTSSTQGGSFGHLGGTALLNNSSSVLSSTGGSSTTTSGGGTGPLLELVRGSGTGVDSNVQSANTSTTSVRQLPPHTSFLQFPPGSSTTHSQSYSPRGVPNNSSSSPSQFLVGGTTLSGPTTVLAPPSLMTSASSPTNTSSSLGTSAFSTMIGTTILGAPAPPGQGVMISTAMGGGSPRSSSVGSRGGGGGNATSTTTTAGGGMGGSFRDTCNLSFGSRGSPAGYGALEISSVSSSVGADGESVASNDGPVLPLVLKNRGRRARRTASNQNFAVTGNTSLSSSLGRSGSISTTVLGSPNPIGTTASGGGGAVHGGVSSGMFAPPQLPPGSAASGGGTHHPLGSGSPLVGFNGAASSSMEEVPPLRLPSMHSAPTLPDGTPIQTQELRVLRCPHTPGEMSLSSVGSMMDDSIEYNPSTSPEVDSALSTVGHPFVPAMAAGRRSGSVHSRSRSIGARTPNSQASAGGFAHFRTAGGGDGPAALAHTHSGSFGRGGTLAFAGSQGSFGAASGGQIPSIPILSAFNSGGDEAAAGNTTTTTNSATPPTTTTSTTAGGLGARSDSPAILHVEGSPTASTTHRSPSGHGTTITSTRAGGGATTITTTTTSSSTTNGGSHVGGGVGGSPQYYQQHPGGPMRPVRPIQLTAFPRGLE